VQRGAINLGWESTKEEREGGKAGKATSKRKRMREEKIDLINSRRGKREWWVRELSDTWTRK